VVITNHPFYQRFTRVFAHGEILGFALWKCVILTCVEILEDAPWRWVVLANVEILEDATQPTNVEILENAP